VSRDNVELVRRAYEAWNAGEFEEAAEVLSPEIEWRLPPNVPDTDTWRSRKEIEQGLEAFMESWAELRAVVRDLRGAGDKGVALVQCQRRSAVRVSRSKERACGPCGTARRSRSRCTAVRKTTATRRPASNRFLRRSSSEK